MGGKKGKGGMPMLLFKTAALALAAGGAAYLLLFASLLWRERQAPSDGGAEAMIVLGAQVKASGLPSEQLRLRLQSALEKYLADRMPIVVCGARGEDEPASEASVMRAWLTQRGVAPEDVLMDEASFDTYQSLKNAAGLLPEGTGRVVIVTSDYHLPRAMAIAGDLGLDAGGIASPTTKEFWLKNHARETLAWGKYLLMKILPGD